MYIKIANLSDGVYDYELNEPLSEFELGEPFIGNIKIAVRLSKIQNQIVLNASFSIDASLTCDRCAKDFKRVLNNSYQMVYILGKQLQDGENDFNISYLPADADKIFIDSDVRDYALLSIPMKKLCREDCKGLCPKCGKDLNEGKCTCTEEEIDERWAPLLELKKKLNSN
jgi:DUF177 domain-containing protein